MKFLIVTESAYSPACKQLATEKQLTHKSANREDVAHLDIVDENFWGRDRQRTLFDVRVFNPFAQSHINTPLAQCYRRQKEKKRAYEERIREVEHGSFSPLVFTTAGGIGAIATVVYKKRLASGVVEKHGKPYGKIMHWLRCQLSYSFLRSAIMCVRGSRHHPECQSSGDSYHRPCLCRRQGPH